MPIAFPNSPSPDDTHTDSNGVVWTYNGTAWTSTTATRAVSRSTVEAKGDLLVGTASSTVARLAVGADAAVLTADSSQSAGVKWASVGGRMTPLDYDYSTVTVGPSSTTETTIYTHDITAGQPQAGDIYELSLSGDLNNSSGSTPVEYTVRIKFGSTTVIATEALSVSNGPLGRRKWHIDVKMYVSSATAQRFSVVGFASQAKSDGAPEITTTPGFVGYGSSTEDTSTAKTLAVTVQLATSDASFDFRCHAGHLRRLTGF